LDYIKEHVPGASMDMLFDIKLCVEEAIRNAILHGNLEREELPVDISYHMDDNKIVISVEAGVTDSTCQSCLTQRMPITFIRKAAGGYT
jgi:two-component sensor histidine kinase